MDASSEQLSVPIQMSSLPSPQSATPPAINVALSWEKTDRLIWLLLLLSFALFFFVVLPIIINLPYVNYPWLNAGDIWKLLDPMFTLPLFYLIWKQSPASETFTGSIHMGTTHLPIYSILDVIFIVCAAVYVEGHGLHTAAAMFKDPLKFLITSQPASAITYPILKETYDYLRDDWEHIYSHYIYLAGAIAMSVLHMVAYSRSRNAIIHGKWPWARLILAVIIYGLLFAGKLISHCPLLFD